MKLLEIAMTQDEWTKFIVKKKIREITQHPTFVLSYLENICEQKVKMDDLGSQLEEFKKVVMTALLKMLHDQPLSMGEESAKANVMDSIKLLGEMGFNTSNWSELKILEKSCK